MDFRQLEAFCAIVEFGNFSNAARYLYITQPTISSHIHRLEEELNTILFERTTKTLSLSDDGKQLYEYAKSILRLRDKTLNVFDRSDKILLHIGASSIPSAYILPEFLSEYRKNNPAVSFNIIQSDSADILEQLKNGSLDAGFTGAAISDERFDCIPICRDEMVLVTPLTDEFLHLKETGTDLLQILQYPYISRENGSGTKMQSELFLKSLQTDPISLNVAVQINGLEPIKQLIAHGLGISILSKRSVCDLESANRVLCFPLDDKGVFREYYLIYQKDRILNKQLVKFIKFARNYYKSAIN